ncbi:MAG TPA: ThiF family adenylyltransferase [Phycisphaerales bacterium]|nr:ThiF family adenylyltransferase [Phycisphaerales bacterium]
MANSRTQRYSRQIILPQVGDVGQARILNGRVAVVGLGALGCSAVDLLARAGVGHLTLVDRDVVEWTNLQRQTLYTEDDAVRGMPKAEAAAARVRAVNSGVECVPLVVDLTSENVERMLCFQAGGQHVIIDATDNHETRFLLNDVAVAHGVPLAYGGVIGTRGMHATFMPGGPCLRCVFGEPAAPGAVPTCDTAGVLGSAVVTVAAAQVTGAIKVLLGTCDRVEGALTDFDVWSGTHRVVQLGAADPACVCCGQRRFEFLGADSGGDVAGLCGQNAVQVRPARTGDVDLGALAQRLAAVGSVHRSRFMVRFVPSESPMISMSIFGDGRGIVHGTADLAVARTAYARFVGV